MKLLPLLALAPFCAQAQLMPPCVPYVPVTPESLYVWSTPKIGLTKNGAYFRYTCWAAQPGLESRTVTYVGLPSEIPKISSRLNTIYSSSLPLRTLQTLPQRITVEDAKLPKFSAILADCEANR